MTIPPRLFRAAGRALYGERWQSALAAILGVTDRTVRRWVAGDYEIPAGVVSDIQNLVVQRSEELADLATQLRQD